MVEAQSLIFNIESNGKSFTLTYHLKDKTTEILDDTKDKATILKCGTYPEILLHKLVPGSKFSVEGQEYKVLDHSNEFTKKFFGERKRTYGMIKPDSCKNIGKIIDMTSQDGFHFNNMKMFKWTKEQAQNFYEEHKGKSFFEGLTDFMSSGPIVGMELSAECAIEKWRALIGPTNSHNARKDAPNSVRARFGTDGQRNAVHGSDAPATAEREIKLVFESKYPTTATFKNCACVLVKPKSINDGRLGKIIDAILTKGFEVTALEMKKISKERAEKFLNEKKEEVDKVMEGEAVVMEVAKENITKELPEVLEVFKDDVYFSGTPEDGMKDCQLFFGA